MRKGATLAVVGGGGFRTPRLLYGLIHHADRLQLAEITLYDENRGRADIMAVLGRHLAETAHSALRIRAVDSVAEAVADAPFVCITIRPGGEDGRVADERVALEAGVLGQETVGPGGFFLALRTMTAMGKLLRQIRAHNEMAWIVNFANPVGILSEAVRRQGEERFVGVCDTPHHLKLELAQYLGADPGSLAIETVGLNHLGWFLAVYRNGVDVLPDLLGHWEDVQKHVRPLSFFAADEVRSLAALPTEYVYLYQHAAAVTERIRGTVPRGEQVRTRSRMFYERAAILVQEGRDADLLALYTETLAGRSNSYFQSETESILPRGLRSGSILATESYERVAIDTMLGLRGVETTNAVILNVPHQGAAGSMLPDDNVMELACRVDRTGIHPIPLRKPVPNAVRSWIERVKRYECATVEAAARPDDREAVIQALALNPVVPTVEVARSLVERRLHVAASHPLEDHAS